MTAPIQTGSNWSTDTTTCYVCGADLDNHLHRYHLQIGIAAISKDSPGVLGLGNTGMLVCPDCIRNFLEQYGIAMPNLMEALHIVNQEEQNPV